MGTLQVNASFMPLSGSMPHGVGQTHCHTTANVVTQPVVKTDVTKCTKEYLPTGALNEINSLGCQNMPTL